MKKRYSLFFLLGIFAFVSCAKSVESIVVTEGTYNPGTENEPTPEGAPPRFTQDEVEFRQLIIGESGSIFSLDPLFLISDAERRTANYVYEGLTKLDELGNVAPALAKEWEISGNGLLYTFHLRTDVFFHDSPVFSSGLGRKFLPSDVVFAFERMAQVNVPKHASELFKSIAGFEAYFNEKRNVLNPELHVVDKIHGIEVINDSTISILLRVRDDEFLKKLAAPEAFLYPKELLAQGKATFKGGIGTGPFLFNNRDAEQTIVLTRNRNYRKPISVTRLDIRNGLTESKLYQEFAAGNIHLLPQPGPDILSTVLNPNNTLAVNFDDVYDLLTPPGEISFELYYNFESLTAGGAVLSVLRSDGPFALPGWASLGFNDPASEISESPSGVSLLASSTQNAYLKFLYVNISRALEARGGKLQLADIRVPFSDINLFSSEFYKPDYEPLITLRSQRFILARENITGIRYNGASWWLDVREANISNL